MIFLQRLLYRLYIKALQIDGKDREIFIKIIKDKDLFKKNVSFLCRILDFKRRRHYITTVQREALERILDER